MRGTVLPLECHTFAVVGLRYMVFGFVFQALCIGAG